MMRTEIWIATRYSSYLLLTVTLFLSKASSIMAMWQRYSVMAECDMQPVSRDTKACTSPTPSLRISMTAMAAYGLGPWKSDPLWTHFKTQIVSIWSHGIFYVLMSESYSNSKVKVLLNIRNTQSDGGLSLREKVMFLYTLQNVIWPQALSNLMLSH